MRRDDQHRSSFGAAALAYAELVTLGRIRAFLASRRETADGEFTLPLLTGVLRLQRL